MGAHAFAVPAVAPDAVMLADARAPAVLAAAQLILWRLCWQMLVPPQSLHLLPWRLCWQILAPPQSLQTLLRLLCWRCSAAGGEEVRQACTGTFLHGRGISRVVMRNKAPNATPYTPYKTLVVGLWWSVAFARHRHCWPYRLHHHQRPLELGCSRQPYYVQGGVYPPCVAIPRFRGGIPQFYDTTHITSSGVNQRS